MGKVSFPAFAFLIMMHMSFSGFLFFCSITSAGHSSLEIVAPKIITYFFTFSTSSPCCRIFLNQHRLTGVSSVQKAFNGPVFIPLMLVTMHLRYSCRLENSSCSNRSTMGQDKWHKLDGYVGHMLNYISHGRLKTTDILQHGTTGRKLRGARDEMGNSPHPIKT